MFPPGLSMLWEPADPHRALEERFGFAGLDGVVGWLSTTLAQTWAVEVRDCERVLISGWNAIAWLDTDRGPIIAKWCGAPFLFDRLAAVADLLGDLHRQGTPVAAPLLPARVLVAAGAGPLSLQLQPRIDGDLLDIDDADAVRRAGACLAVLHAALDTLDDPRLAVGAPDPRDRITAWLDVDDPGLVPSASARLRELVGSLPAIDATPQLIHNDYRAANILTAGPEIRAVLDFDEVTHDHRVRDIANSFVRLGTWFHDWRPTPVHVRRTFLAGYESVRALTPVEHGWLRALTLWFDVQAVPRGDDPAGWAAAAVRDER